MLGPYAWALCLGPILGPYSWALCLGPMLGPYAWALCLGPMLELYAWATSSRWLGQQLATRVGPRSASSTSRHSTSSRSVAPPENVSVTAPPGGLTSANSTARRLRILSFLAGSTFLHLQASTRSNRSAARQRRSSGLAAIAAGQSNRSSARTSRFSAGRQCTSATLTSASWRWAETTSRSSLSRATNLTGSMAGSLGRLFL